MAVPVCTLTPADYSAAIATQIPQLTWENVENIAQNDPYASVFDSGTFPNFQGETIRTIVLDRIVTGHSMTRPAVVSASQSCGTVGPQSRFGQSEFTTILGNIRGESPLVCVKGARIVVEQGYEAATLAMRAGLKEIMLADRRISLLDLSGLKYVAKANGTVEANLRGTENDTSTPFGQGLPTAPMRFKALEALADVLRYDFNNIQTFGNGADEHFIAIFGSNQVNQFRNEAGVIENFRSGTEGGFSQDRAQLFKYAFNPLYRGIRVGIDPRPLRFNTVNAAGNPIFIEPYITATSDLGQLRNIINPNWRLASYEVGFLISKGAFKYLTPTSMTRIGDMHWPSTMSPGELRWINPQDLNCNKYQDFGQFIWEVERAIQPRVPHGVIGVLYTRCNNNLGLTACDPIVSV
jgi:hypothetical protein